MLRALGGAVCALAAVGTLSRSALLAGAAGLAVHLALSGRIPRGGAAVAAAAVLAAAIALAQPLAARFAAPAPDEGDARRLLDVSGHGRSELWRVAAEAWRDAPVLGRGAGTYPRELIARTGDLAGPADAHSLYLETLAELGLVGLALLLLFLGLCFRTQAPMSPAAAAVVAAWAVQAAVDWIWQLPAATLPALLAAGALARRPERRARPLLLAAGALALGIAAGLHGLGAAIVETGADAPGRARAAARLLPWDARPWATVDPGRACATDPGEPVLVRLHGGCG